MGIQKLTKLVTGLNGVYQDVEFRDGSLVIDGSNLVYHLYFTSGLDQNHGGEYGAFKDLVTQFTEALRHCGIRPYVVFDGCADLSNQKVDTENERMAQRVQNAHRAAQTGRPMGVLPPLIWDVFRQTLHGLHVPLARSYTEADRQAAALAQEWDCPVLSNDSDFFIFPLSRGMLPTTHFRWQEALPSGAQRFIRCKRYLSSRFCAVVSIRTQLLPVFAVLAGNDYTKNKAEASGNRFSQQHTKLQDLLRWISGFKDADPRKLFEEFLRNISSEEREQRIRGLQEVAELYSLPPSSLSDFFNQGTLPPLPPQMVDVVPDWMRRPVTEAQFSSDFLDVLVSQRVGLSVMVDHMDKPSANQVSLPLRRTLYCLLLGRDKAVEERDRDGLKVILNKVQTDLCVPPQLNLQTLPQTDVQQRRQLLLKTLGVTEQTLSSLPPDLKHLELPLAATCFWLKKVGPRADLLKGLIIGWCNSDGPPPKADSMPMLQTDWCHCFNLWQSCFRDSFLLNQLLGKPLPEPPMARLFSGTFVHHLLHKMRSVCPDACLQSYINNKSFKALLDIVQHSQSPVQGHTAPPENVALDQRPASWSHASKRPKTSNDRK